jgi:hypothetical protein
LGLSLSSEVRGDRIFLKFLHDILALIQIHFCQLENFSDQRRFFGNFSNLAQSQKLKFGKLVQIVAEGYSNCKNTKKDFYKKPTYIP